MSIFNKSKKKNEENLTEKAEVAREWVWVDGYKGTDENMKCKDFQYEIGKSFTCDEKDVLLCESGFHLCLDIEDVFSYYKIDGKNRYFKVRALAEKNPQRPADTTGLMYFPISSVYGNTMSSKCVAKEIQIVEECKFDDIKKYVKKNYPFIENMDEYKFITDYKNFSRKKFSSEMQKLGFTELFSTLLFDNALDKTLILESARSFVAEGISKDIMVYMLVMLNRK
jgi:hypothetical protein